MSPTQYTGRRFRAALLHYGLGRGANALLSIALFVTLARVLPVREYGAYVALWALAELLLALGNLGTEWITATELPRLVQQGQGPLARRFSAKVLAAQSLSFASMGLLCALAAAWIAALLHIDELNAVRMFAALVFVEGVSRAVRDQFLSGLLLQWVSQLGQILRNAAVLLTLLACAATARPLKLWAVLALESAAAAVALMFTAAYLLVRLRQLPAPLQGHEQRLDWPGLRRRALHAWMGSVAAVLMSAQTVLLMLTRVLGPELSAVVGFARNLAEQVRRFMPLEFGFIILRTYLVSRFAAEGSKLGLLRRLDVVWRWNAALVLLALVLAANFGDAIANLVAGSAKFQGAASMLSLWLVWVLVWSQRRPLETAVHILAVSRSIGQASLLLLPCLLLLWLAAQSPWPLLAIGVLAAGEALYGWRLARAIGRVSQRFPFEFKRLALLLGCALLAFAVGLVWLRSPLSQWSWLLGAAVTSSVFAVLLALSGAIGRDDLRAFKRSYEVADESV